MPPEEWDQVGAIWASQLERFDDATLRLALDAFMDSGARFAPSLPEFFALCKQFRPRPTAPLTLAAPRTGAPEGVFERLRRELERAKPDETAE